MTPDTNLEKESNQFKSHGGARPGAGRPPGSPNKLTRPLKEAAALHTEECLAVLVFLRDHGESEQVRFAACRELLDRGHGKPRQIVDFHDERVVIVLNPNVDEEGPVLIEDQSDET